MSKYFGPDKTSMPVLTKCLQDKTSKAGRSWQNVFLTKCLRRSWQNVFLAKRPTWQNEFWDFTFRKHEPHFLNRNIPKQDRANTKQCISIYWTLDRRYYLCKREKGNGAKWTRTWLLELKLNWSPFVVLELATIASSSEIMAKTVNAKICFEHNYTVDKLQTHYIGCTKVVSR